MDDVYYQKVKELNIAHYSGEVPYYVNAALRPSEESLLKRLVPGSRILDLGCGAGRFSLGAAQNGFRVTGVDITPNSIEAAKQKAVKLGLSNAVFQVGDMTELNFADGTFDYVICPRFSINAVATFKRRTHAVREMIRIAQREIFIESFNKFYLGRGLLFFLRGVLRDFLRHTSFASEHAGLRLLPGDILYEATKVSGAPLGYAHIPTPFELARLVPYGVKFKFYSDPQMQQRLRHDSLKFLRYSLWLHIKKS